MRSVFKKNGGNLGETNSVAWMFARVGEIEAVKKEAYDLDEEAIEAGADDAYKNDDGTCQFFTAPENLDALNKALTGRGWKINSAALSYKATNIADITEEQRKEVEEFLTALDDMDDTHKVYATLG
jgi:transcriptional/translational regulatory protein YebC/TACO1